MTGGIDEGTDDGGRPDGARPDGGTGTGEVCFRVEAGSETNRLTVTDGSGMSREIDLGRVFAKWVPAPCDTPPRNRRLVVGLTRTSCALGVGHRFTVNLVASQLGINITPGPFDIERRAFVSIRYVVPAAGGAAEQRWGNCTGATGSLVLERADDVGGAAGGDGGRAPRLEATFDTPLRLTDCTGMDAAPIRVTGAFDVAVNRSFDDACTPAMP